MVTRESRKKRWSGLKLGMLITFFLTVCLTCFKTGSSAQTGAQSLSVTPGFTAAQAVAPDARIELNLSRALQPAEGRLAVLIGNTDLSALFIVAGSNLSYTPRFMLLPLGDTAVTVYLVSPGDEWQEVARFPLLVASQTVSAPPQDQPQPAATPETAAAKKFIWTPALTLGFKSQAAESHFPTTNRPERPTYGDVTLQGSLRTDWTRGLFNSQTQFDIVGSSYQKEALRFGQMGNAAPQVDLSSYLMQFQINQAKLLVGHIGYGTNRHLINSFASRGITLQLPLSRWSDFSVGAMNGTSIVGWDNFFGLNRRQHQMVTGTLGFEFLPKRRGGLRLEAGALHGSLLPLSGFNQGNVNDAERSRGGSLRLIASDQSQRFRFEGGLARSSFTNPRDPLLEQKTPVVAVRETARNARYLEASYNLLRNLKLSPTKTANLTLNYRHERVDPLYRSVAAFAQADRNQNQFEVVSDIGGITATLAHQRLNDNLDEIPSILKTLTRRYHLIVSLPLLSLMGDPNQPSPWLPRLSYIADRTHQLGKALPVNSGFDSLSQVPDQVSTNQSFNAEWQWPRWRFGYRFNHSFQDNRQPGRELADLRNMIHGFTLGLNPASVLDLNFDVNAESARNRQLNRTDRLLRFGTNLNWRMTKKATLATTLSTVFAGDVARTSRSRNAELDLQWSYQFGFGENGWKKVKGQFFIRYANRYAHARDSTFGLNNLTKLQTLNAGLSFIFF